MYMRRMNSNFRELVLTHCRTGNNTEVMVTVKADVNADTNVSGIDRGPGPDCGDRRQTERVSRDIPACF